MSEMVERVARAIRLDDGSPCISMTRKACADPSGCICRSLALAAIEVAVEEAASIALAINSGRGNEKEIAKAIRALAGPDGAEGEG